jgi:hypothetical protein
MNPNRSTKIHRKHNGRFHGGVAPSRSCARFACVRGFRLTEKAHGASPVSLKMERGECTQGSFPAGCTECLLVRKNFASHRCESSMIAVLRWRTGNSPMIRLLAKKQHGFSRQRNAARKTNVLSGSILMAAIRQSCGRICCRKTPPDATSLQHHQIRKMHVEIMPINLNWSGFAGAAV